MADGVPSVPLWLWGVVICVLATAMTALGLVLQKLSHTLNAQSPKAGFTPQVYYKQPWWLAGFGIFAFAQVINLISMALAPQVMLSCLGATALIFNAVFAWLILEEELHRFEAFLMFGIIVSVVMVISNTPVSPADPAPADVFHDCVGPIFSLRFVSLAACIVTMLTILRFSFIESGLARDVPDLAAAVWTLCSAAASGYTVNLWKATAEFVTAWPEIRPLIHWECYVVLVMACAFGIAQVHCLNCALNLGRAMMVVPTYFSLALLAQLGIAEAITPDFPTQPVSIAIFISGIAFIMVFIVLLVRTKIAYEEEPDAEFEEVFEKALSVSLPGSPRRRGTTESTSLLGGVPTSPVRQASPDRGSTSPPPPELDEALDFSAMSPMARRNSFLDSDAFQDSFEGRERVYSVSVFGLGVA